MDRKRIFVSLSYPFAFRFLSCCILFPSFFNPIAIFFLSVCFPFPILLRSHPFPILLVFSLNFRLWPSGECFPQTRPSSTNPFSLLLLSDVKCMLVADLLSLLFSLNFPFTYLIECVTSLSVCWLFGWLVRWQAGLS